MTIVTPVQTNTYVLDTSLISTVFGAGSNINVANGDGVWGPNEANSWLLTTNGTITGTTGVELDFISYYVNNGSVTGTTGAGVALTASGIFDNHPGGSINATGAGSWGVVMTNTGGGYGSIPSTFGNHGLIDGVYGGVQLTGSIQSTNTGTIEGGTIGLTMNGGGALKNRGTIVGTGQTGAYFGGTTTVDDYGTITGGVNAVQFAGSGANALTLESGAKLNGAIMGSSAVGATTSLTLLGKGTFNGALQQINSVNAAGTGTWVLNGHSSVSALSVASGAGLQVGDATHAAASLAITTLQNAGTVTVDAGKLDIHKVAGSGSLFILGGTLELGASTQEAIAFGSNAGVLELDHSMSFHGTVGGFDPSGSAIDLSDVKFVGSGEATFKGTTSGGTLTVSDGSHTARIALTGDFTGASFVAQSDGHGGTLVYDPVAATTSALADLLHQSLGVSII